MNFLNGQFLRRLGLVVEAGSMLAILQLRRGPVEFWARNGIDPNAALPAAFLLGLMMWGAGVMMVRRERLRDGRE